MDGIIRQNDLMNCSTKSKIVKVLEIHLTLIYTKSAHWLLTVFSLSAMDSLCNLRSSVFQVLLLFCFLCCSSSNHSAWWFHPWWMKLPVVDRISLVNIMLYSSSKELSTFNRTVKYYKLCKLLIADIFNCLTASKKCHNERGSVESH